MAERWNQSKIDRVNRQKTRNYQTLNRLMSKVTTAGTTGFQNLPKINLNPFSKTPSQAGAALKLKGILKKMENAKPGSDLVQGENPALSKREQNSLKKLLPAIGVSLVDAHNLVKAMRKDERLGKKLDELYNAVDPNASGSSSSYGGEGGYYAAEGGVGEGGSMSSEDSAIQGEAEYYAGYYSGQGYTEPTPEEPSTDGMQYYHGEGGVGEGGSMTDPISEEPVDEEPVTGTRIYNRIASASSGRQELLNPTELTSVDPGVGSGGSGGGPGGIIDTLTQIGSQVGNQIAGGARGLMTAIQNIPQNNGMPQGGQPGAGGPGGTVDPQPTPQEQIQQQRQTAYQQSYNTADQMLRNQYANWGQHIVQMNQAGQWTRENRENFRNARMQAGMQLFGSGGQLERQLRTNENLTNNDVQSILMATRTQWNNNGQTLSRIGLQYGRSQQQLNDPITQHHLSQTGTSVARRLFGQGSVQHQAAYTRERQLRSRRMAYQGVPGYGPFRG